MSHVLSRGGSPVRRSCSCKIFLKLRMLELNCQAQMMFSLVAFEQTKQINFCEILCPLTLHRHTCDSFSAHSRNGIIIIVNNKSHSAVPVGALT